MIKVKIVLDEEKIIQERKYNLEKMWEALDAAFLSKNIRIEEKGMYVGTNHPDDFANVWLICYELGQKDWFLFNVVEWKYYNNDMCKNKDDYNVENLLEDSELYKVGFR